MLTIGTFICVTHHGCVMGRGVFLRCTCHNQEAADLNLGNELFLVTLNIALDLCQYSQNTRIRRLGG